MVTYLSSFSGFYFFLAQILWNTLPGPDVYVISFHVRFFIFFSFKPGSSEYIQPAVEQIVSRRC